LNEVSSESEISPNGEDVDDSDGELSNGFSLERYHLERILDFIFKRYFEDWTMDAAISKKKNSGAFHIGLIRRKRPVNG